MPFTHVLYSLKSPPAVRDLICSLEMPNSPAFAFKSCNFISLIFFGTAGASGGFNGPEFFDSPLPPPVWGGLAGGADGLAEPMGGR